MAEHVTDHWEETLDAYLEGHGLRADAQELLMRLHLSSADRDEIERSLWLSDELTAALREIQPPAGHGERLVARLREMAAPETMPKSLVTAAATPETEQELLDATATEGGGSLGELSDVVGEVSPREAEEPAGMKGRLVAKLQAHMMSEEIDPKVVERLLGKGKRSQPRVARPDVLAAEEKPEGGDQG